MLSSLSSGVSGLENFQEQMDVIGNNIANINTTGFKSATGNLVDSFSNTLQAATASSTTNTTAANPIQIGTGVTTASITNDWTTGQTNSTPDYPSNLAITGPGFFIVQDPNNATAQYATQDGSFTINKSGFLVSNTGMEVVGYNDGPTLSKIGPIQINTANSTSTAAMTGFTIGASGIITVTQADGTTFNCGQVLLQNYTNPQALTSVGNNLYSNLAAGGGLATMSTPGNTATGVGAIQSNALELSNVNLSDQMANLIIAQRGFEANSKIVTTSDELLQDVVNMKH
jgi:flagellar hook protein FlgE